ncbi:MAG: phytoene/squalene synthase family protein [Microbacterium sp.]|uniref:phytoene/squalene synthase family protein n=1 Tax=Microbacterium sp. TaxID=51671 RepID=UPI001AD106CA|nr:phytoene/squalene synthase family protein [Microbacterium sp.]MBN9176017.1 phytoene/squalene synthase family protein [Microbacterium sp.]
MTGLTPYDRCAQDAAASVIASYSTSFALATRLLGPRVRTHVRSVYALVRVADEIVDGAAARKGVSPEAQRALLDAFEAETHAAVERRFSTDLVIHAFALAAAECGIGADLTRPFFASMRTDLERTRHDATSHEEYVYGSAEVVGLMCLQVFVNAGRAFPVDPDPGLVEGARRLGAAFQDVNFLRDLADDRGRLGRDYLGIGEGGTDERATRAAVLARIDADLDVAATAISGLPADCRRAVTTAHGLFAELAHRLREDAGDVRVSVPTPVKATIAAKAFAGVPPRRSGT